MILRCQAPKKQGRGLRTDRPCDGFVGRFAYPVEVVTLLAHSDLRTSEANHVVACQRCGMLHEVARKDTLAIAA